MEKSIVQRNLAQLPQEPGVYFFMDKNGKILYVGKATNLKSRVQSYFRNGDNRGEWIAKMVLQIWAVKFEQTDSVLEALILESNLIKKHQPKYNTLEKDDKSFAYFVVTKEEFPRVLIFRATDINFKTLEAGSQKLAAVYGPYTFKKQMQIALKIIRKIFPFHSMNQKTEKGCLDFQIGLCPGPYAGEISKEDYKKNIRGIKMILEGKKKSLVKKMEREMKESAKKHEFEKAADLRNKIFALQHIHDIALISKNFESGLEARSQKLEAIRIEAYDISNISGQHAVGSMVVFSKDVPDKPQYRKFKIKTIEGSDDVGMMEEVLLRRFHNDWPMPDLILLDGGQGHLNMAKKLLHEKLGLDVAVVAVAKGAERKKLDLRFDIHNLRKEIKDMLNNRDLLRHVMDEAHRFAITYHRKVCRRNALS